MGVLSLEVEKGLYLGIDFGTTNSVVSIFHYDTNEVHTLKIDGYTVFPSVVQFEKEYESGELVRIFGIEVGSDREIFRLSSNKPFYSTN